ncbi:hypothetical protein EJ02DRAFT_466693 [Clathrospora elynae]|uniref:Uncharacterized protein n=1 Tax=Clathrospora elynae TaxID=706981 RepID=A0A6A5SNJ5_9PLEO|nr:hypothetical protein EJ02DRAFT_466693 [Clathrospora elynae]
MPPVVQFPADSDGGFVGYQHPVFASGWLHGMPTPGEMPWPLRRTEADVDIGGGRGNALILRCSMRRRRESVGGELEDCGDGGATWSGLNRGSATQSLLSTGTSTRSSLLLVGSSNTGTGITTTTRTSHSPSRLQHPILESPSWYSATAQ